LSLDPSNLACFGHQAVFDIDMRRCPSCGAGELKIIAAILLRAAIEKTLARLGLDHRAPPCGRANEAGRACAAG